MFVIFFLIISTWFNLKVNNDTTSEIQNEQQICINPTDSLNIVAVWRDFRLGYRRIGIGTSTDGGITWSNQLLSGTNYTRDSDPALTYSSNGIFYTVVLAYESTSQPNGLFLFRSTDKGFTWDGPYTVIDNVPGVFEDKELVACDRTSSAFSGNIYVTWARFYNIDIMCSRSTDSGSTFDQPVQVSDNSASLQWPVPAVGPNGVLYIAWDDMTNNCIKIDKSTDGGFTFSSDIIVQNTNFVYGYINGGITVFSFPALDIDITGGSYDGTLYIAYMDDSPSHTDQDIYLTKSTDQGLTWSSKIRVNDDPLNNGCDQFHPWLIVDQDGRIVIIWLDRRLDVSNYLYDCYMTYSIDGGQNFVPNIRISTVSSDPNASGDAGLLGEYIGVASFHGDIHPIWTDTREGNQDSYTAYQISAVEENIFSSDNPANEIFIGNISFNFENPVDIFIYDISGRTVNSFYQITDFNWKPENLPSGLYMISFKDNFQILNKKILFLN